MGIRGRTQVPGLVLSGMLVLGTVGVAVPAYAAPQDCPGTDSCDTTGTAPQPVTPTPKPSPKPTPRPAAKPTPQPTAGPVVPPPDTEAPNAPFFGEATVSPDGLVELTVAAEASSLIVLREDDEEVIAQATATGAAQDLSWTTADGTHTYSLTATDAERNESEAAVVTVEVDATPPPVNRFVTRSGTGSSSASYVRVATEPDTAFRLLVDGKPVQEGTTDADGLIEQTLDLADGRHPVQVELRDEVGNLTTATRPLVVKIPDLAVSAVLTTGVTDEVQVVRVKARAATTGVVEVPGEPGRRFELAGGTAEVELDLADGSYDDVTVTVSDALGRTGTTTLPAIEVDLTAPALTVVPDRDAAADGKLAAKVRTDENTVVSWRLLDGDRVVADGKYVAVGTDQTIRRDVEEGSYELEVTATDTYGRTTVERITTPIASDPVPAAVIVLAVLGLLVVLGAVVAGALVLWRRHDADDDDAPQEVTGRRAIARVEARHRDQEAAFAEADELWRRRRDVLVRLLAVAQGGAPAEVDPGLDLSLLPDEAVLYTTAARLTEKVGADRSAAAVGIDQGSLLVTNQRFAFVGAEHHRDWWYALVERVAHVDHQHTTIELWDSATRSGIEYDDPEVTRLYLDLAMSERNGTRSSYLTGLAQGLRDHEMRRPTPPTPLSQSGRTAQIDARVPRP